MSSDLLFWLVLVPAALIVLIFDAVAAARSDINKSRQHKE